MMEKPTQYQTNIEMMEPISPTKNDMMVIEEVEQNSPI
jgi:hypothetical protein